MTFKPGLFLGTAAVLARRKIVKTDICSDPAEHEKKMVRQRPSYRPQTPLLSAVPGPTGQPQYGCGCNSAVPADSGLYEAPIYDCSKQLYSPQG